MDMEKLPRVVGQNCARIRREHRVTQSELASHARRVGLRWNNSKVADFESGRTEKISLADVAALALALDNAIGAGPGPAVVWRADGTAARRKRPRVRLADLVQFDGFISLTDDFAPTGDALAAFFSGRPWELGSGDTAETDADRLLSPAPGVLGKRYRMRVSDVEDMRRRSDVAERRVCQRLGIGADTLLGLSWRLWHGRTFGEERDRRAGANPALRAAVSRELRAELEKELTRGDH